jgi:hypothetical protein
VELDILINPENKNVNGIFGVALQAAEYEMSKLDGKIALEKIH